HAVLASVRRRPGEPLQRRVIDPVPGLVLAVGDAGVHARLWTDRCPATFIDDPQRFGELLNRLAHSRSMSSVRPMAPAKALARSPCSAQAVAGLPRPAQCTLVTASRPHPF